MPSDGRWVRRRTGSETRDSRGAPIRLIRREEFYAEENPVVGSDLSGSSGLGRHPIMAATPQPSWQASLRGHRAEGQQSLVKMWAHSRLVLLLLTICAVMLLCHYLGFGFLNFTSESKYIPRSNENPNGQSLEKTSAWEALFSYFFPTTCIIKENEEVKACNNLQNLNKSECLEYKCCYSSSGTSNFSCYAPLNNKPLQMIRIFGFSVISIIMLGCLPIYCCFTCWRSGTLRYEFNSFCNRAHKSVNSYIKLPILDPCANTPTSGSFRNHDS
ncbi:FMR1 neighbor protein [Saccopteryx bilineata]|uniref:FMR1 neighbor protein n=1 Tax=Saccopteryx bilineata TaxID=59482 RepID=UPI00338DFB73